MPQSRRQLFLNYSNVCNRAIIRMARALAGHVRHGDDMNLVPEMIKGQQAIKEHHGAIGKMKIVFGVIADFFQLPDTIVSKVTYCARSKRGQSRNARRTVRLQKFFEDLHRPSLALFTALAARQDNLVASCLHLHVRAGTEKCIAANLLAALDGFQEERIALVSCDSKKCGNRSQ